MHPRFSLDVAQQRGPSTTAEATVLRYVDMFPPNVGEYKFPGGDAAALHFDNHGNRVLLITLAVSGSKYQFLLDAHQARTIQIPGTVDNVFLTDLTHQGLPGAAGLFAAGGVLADPSEYPSGETDGFVFLLTSPQPFSLTTSAAWRPSTALGDLAGNPVTVTGGALLTALLGTNTVNGCLQVATLYNPLTQGMEQQRTPTKFIAYQATSSGTGTGTLWTPTAGKRFRILACQFGTTAACNLFLQDGGGAAALVIQAGPLAPPVVLPGNGYLSSAINNVLTYANAPATALVGGWIAGTEE